MKKCAFSLLLVLVMVFGLLPMTAQAEELDNGLVYEVYDDYVEITDYTGDATEVVIPTEIEGLPVTSIGRAAFRNCTSLTSISIPDAVTSIRNWAFSGCTSLVSVEIPDGVTSIDSYTFYDCTGLTSIGIPDAVTSIGSWAFENCSGLASIDLPDNLTSIGMGAFAYCTSLTSISIPESVTDIAEGYKYDEYAFAYCTSLTGVHVDKNNQYYSADDRGILFDKEKTKLIAAPATIAGSYTIPDGVTSICAIAFFECNNLIDINIPNSVNRIDVDTFRYCASLNKIHVDDSNQHYSSDNRGVLFNKEKTKLILAPAAIAGSYTIPDGVTSIGAWSFTGCKNLTNISIPDGVNSVGYVAFMSCKNLTTMTIPSSVTSIGDYAFDGCERMTSVVFRGDAPKFGYGVFWDVTATAYYPAGNPTWTSDVMKNYSGTITWVPYTPSPFNDAAIGSFYYDPVLWAVENGITTGATATSFNPNGTCLRAQVVTFLHRADGNPEPTSSKNPFTDVKSGDFFYKPVLWAVEKGITNGVDATTFGSYANCNRAAVVTFLWRAAGSPEPESTNNPFVDVKTTDFFYKPVLWAVENGITNGVDATHFGPAADCNRAQVVTFLYRAFSEQ